ncbi:PREDICTED: uncharacterized protein LOC106816218 isoform X2 [Priapulus caudatus]|uniref:Uncharacterized protein LOC106816218 isoform X2 n=1 Tax=Priapulus caudatus TaxID=37621 RepID=A0ABM1EVQ9_PRICU|nr:PREDICTED: uncharacterized protein LOC106816218 isoform X2 [Priapulus caudatus]
MPLKFKLPFPNTMIVRHKNMIYKAKIVFRGPQQDSLRKISQNDIQSEMEVAVRAALHMKEDMYPFRTDHFVIYPYSKKWRLAQEIVFLHHKKMLQTYHRVIIINVEVISQQEGSNTIQDTIIPAETCKDVNEHLQFKKDVVFKIPGCLVQRRKREETLPKKQSLHQHKFYRKRRKPMNNVDILDNPDLFKDRPLSKDRQQHQADSSFIESDSDIGSQLSVMDLIIKAASKQPRPILDTPGSISSTFHVTEFPREDETDSDVASLMSATNMRLMEAVRNKTRVLSNGNCSDKTPSCRAVQEHCLAEKATKGIYENLSHETGCVPGAVCSPVSVNTVRSHSSELPAQSVSVASYPTKNDGGKLPVQPNVATAKTANVGQVPFSVYATRNYVDQLPVWPTVPTMETANEYVSRLPVQPVPVSVETASSSHGQLSVKPFLTSVSHCSINNGQLPVQPISEAMEAALCCSRQFPAWPVAEAVEEAKRSGRQLPVKPVPVSVSTFMNYVGQLPVEPGSASVDIARSYSEPIPVQPAVTTMTTASNNSGQPPVQAAPVTLQAHGNYGDQSQFHPTSMETDSNCFGQLPQAAVTMETARHYSDQLLVHPAPVSIYPVRCYRSQIPAPALGGCVTSYHSTGPAQTNAASLEVAWQCHDSLVPCAPVPVSAVAPNGESGLLSYQQALVYPDSSDRRLMLSPNSSSTCPLNTAAIAGSASCHQQAGENGRGTIPQSNNLPHLVDPLVTTCLPAAPTMPEALPPFQCIPSLHSPTLPVSHGPMTGHVPPVSMSREEEEARKRCSQQRPPSTGHVSIASVWPLVAEPMPSLKCSSCNSLHVDPEASTDVEALQKSKSSTSSQASSLAHSLVASEISEEPAHLFDTADACQKDVSPGIPTDKSGDTTVHGSQDSTASYYNVEMVKIRNQREQTSPYLYPEGFDDDLENPMYGAVTHSEDEETSYGDDEGVGYDEVRVGRRQRRTSHSLLTAIVDYFVR